MATTGEDVERITVWRCIGCGKIEGPQPCVGICQDRRVEMVFGDAHDAAMAEAGRLAGRVVAMEALLRRLLHTTPRDGAWEDSWREFQRQARAALAADGE